jgi:putative membrane protein
MIVLALVFGALAALFHVMAFVFESILWTRPAIYGRFGVKSQAEADTVKNMAYNQGFYNLALALGVVVGLVLLPQGGDTFVVAKTLVVFGTACMTIAGLVLATTGRSYLRSAAIQFGLSALALVSVILV